jgi:hypothetical protein
MDANTVNKRKKSSNGKFLEVLLIYLCPVFDKYIKNAAINAMATYSNNVSKL